MDSLEQQYLSRARNELTEHIVYHKLSLREKKTVNREALEKLSTQEKSHYEFWRTLLPQETAIKPSALAVYGIPLLHKIFGVTFTTKLLESHEKNAVANYEKMLAKVPDSHKKRLELIIEDERFHERTLISKLKEKRVAYIGFVALGLSDAIVEITGVHAGFLGVTGSTLIAGISGVIVGFAAAISMGAAAYLQAKQDTEKSAALSAFVTGISYMISVICLALPYFLIHTMLIAFITSTLIGILLLAAFTFYGAVVFDRKFSRELAESVSLMLGTAIATYILGTFVGNVFHIKQANF
ncbi:MAG: rubrerythrin family protein [Patescibacteria group bacterium]|nr:VIT1/CCC1 family protein [Patescibacteria group bacterium]MDE2014920.1 rubrerythrin family protein [Patescibacteria group bacterium]MDE2226349.1 rubrerythrin family protein [Patescibacteria group bacterium]